MVNNITIDRECVRRAFRQYTDAYDVTDEKIRLKIGHTYRVAELCERIANSEGLSKEDVDISWLLGMLHDIGRFEQLRRYDTFDDLASVDHAALGADILFGTDKSYEEHIYDTDCKTNASEGKNIIRRFIPDCGFDPMIETAIRIHSAYRVPKGLDRRTRILSDILRDADKIDILRVNLETPMEEIYNTTTEALRTDGITPEVLSSFYEHHAVLKSLKKTSVDHVVGHCSLVYELVYRESRRIVDEQGYLWRLMEYRTDNPTTAMQFENMREEMKRFLKGEDNAQE